MMTDKAQREQRRAQQAQEIEESQSQMRKNISETERLVGESEAMLRRHREEREHDEDSSD